MDGRPISALDFERERWRRAIQSAGTGDVANLKQVASTLLDAYCNLRAVTDNMARSAIFGRPVVQPEALGLPPERMG